MGHSIRSIAEWGWECKRVDEVDASNSPCGRAADGSGSSWHEMLHYRSMIGCLQELEGSPNHCYLSLPIMRETEWASHQVWSQQDTWRFKQFCIPLKCLDVDTDSRNADGFDGACKVTDRYMAGGSACRQENGIDMSVLEHLCPLR